MLNNSQIICSQVFAVYSWILHRVFLAFADVLGSDGVSRLAADGDSLKVQLVRLVPTSSRGRGGGGAKLKTKVADADSFITF